MGGGKFSWIKPDVLPVVGALATGVAFSVYSIFRNLTTNPDVHLSKSYRMEGVPESGVIEQRSSGYNSPSVYKALQEERSKKTHSEGRTRIF